MKKLVLIFLIIFLTSCVKYIEEIVIIKSNIVYRKHVDARSEYTYHYGYDNLTGKYCYHYGMENFPEENIVKFIFNDELIETDDAKLLNKLTDSITITYAKVYVQTKDSTYFHHNKILKVE